MAQMKININVRELEPVKECFDIFAEIVKDPRIDELVRSEYKN